MTFFHIAALALVAVVARAAPLASRDCASVPGVNTGVRNQIYQVALSRGLTASSLCMEVMFCTAITESNVNNLPCGDQDSLGVFQQRPSQGWGTHDQLLDVTYSTNAFLDVAIPLCNSEPNADAGDIAQQVQNAQAGNRYTQNEGEAKQLIAEAEAAVGGGSAPASSSKPSSGSSGGAVNVGASPSKAAPKPSPKPSAAAPKPSSAAPASSAPSGAPAGDDAEGDGDCSELPADCTHSYTPVPGDDCYGVSGRFGISLAQFYEWNPSIDSLCHNLEITQAYCVAVSGN